MNTRRVLSTALFAMVFLLMGCAPAEFSRAQTVEDRPASVVEGAGDKIDTATLRHVGKADEYDVYFARGADDPETLCLSLALGDVWQRTECAEDAVSVRISDIASVNAEFNFRGGEGREMLSENVWVSSK